MLVLPSFQPLFRAVGLDADGVFTDPRVRVWRKLPDRENCVLDATGPDGEPTRLHVKRYEPVPGQTPADVERRGHEWLIARGIPTAPLAAWGETADRRSFTIWPDLAGFVPGDKLVAGGTAFERLLTGTADLAAKLHAAGLHHRDLYLCHFMAKVPPVPEGDATSADAPVEVRLIDVARVRPLPSYLTRRRWVVKDLAQFWYSTTGLPVTDDQRDRWLARYAEARGNGVTAASLRSSILRKARSIARHDRRLNADRPERNVSVPA